MYDIEAIKKRIQALEGKPANSLNMWKPKPGVYKVRALPGKNGDPAMPFLERQFYYIGKNRGFLAPFQFGEKDPVKELCNRLYSTGNEADKLLAKQLKPSMRAYAPIIVRGQEDQGVKVWAFSKVVYGKLLGYYGDEDVGDVLDLENGFDIKVTITQPAGKQYPTTDVEVRKPSPAGSKEDIQKWMDERPDIDSTFEKKSLDDIKRLLDAWLEDPTASAAESSSDGTQKGAGSAQVEPDKKKTTSKIDDAFAELMND